MSTNPFSPHPFPFSDEDLLLFGTSHNDPNAWADFGQGRSVSSMMDVSVMDTPTLEAPLNPFSPITQQQQQQMVAPPLKGTKRGSNTEVPRRQSQQKVEERERDGDRDSGSKTETPAQKRQRRDVEESEESEESSGRRRTSSVGDRARLTEQEKKSNHIASEQKRRMAIRDGFDRLTTIVPGLEGQGRSESIVLKKSVDHMRKILDERQALLRRLEELGGEVPKELILR